MNFLNGKEELDLVVQALQKMLPKANIGQNVLGSTSFYALVSVEDGKVQLINFKVSFEWANKVIGAFILGIESEFNIAEISERQKHESYVDEVIKELNLVV